MTSTTVKRGLKIGNYLPVRSNIKTLDNTITSSPVNELEIIKESGEIISTGTTIIDAISGKNITVRLPEAYTGAIKEITVSNHERSELKRSEQKESEIILITSTGCYKFTPDYPYQKFVCTDNGWRPLSVNTIAFPHITREILECKKLIGTKSGFGSTLCFSGNGRYLFVGCPNENILLGPIGCVVCYFYDNEKWIECGKLDTLDDVALSSGQGSSISTTYTGDKIVIGGPLSNNTRGKAWVWEKKDMGWRIKQSLTSVTSGSEARGNEVTREARGSEMTSEMTSEARGETKYFGCSVSMNFDGTKVVVGSDNGVFVYQEKKNEYAELQQYFFENSSKQTPSERLSGVFESFTKESQIFQEQYELVQYILPSITDLIYIVDTTSIINCGSKVFMSNDGSRIVFTSKGVVWIYDLCADSRYVLKTHLSGESSLMYADNVAINSDATVITVSVLDSNLNCCVLIYYEFNGEWTCKQLKTGVKSCKIEAITTNAKGDTIALTFNGYKGSVVWYSRDPLGNWIETGKNSFSSKINNVGIALNEYTLAVGNGNVALIN